MPDSGGVAKVPGQVSRLADARGGPANFAGVGFQVLVQVELLLDWILSVRHDPVSSVVVRCEAREFDEGGQLGYDIADEGGNQGFSRLFEVKLKPVKAEILDLLARARRLAEANSSDVVGLVSEAPTGPFMALDRLHRHFGESVNAADFEARVRAHADVVEVELFDALGGSPMAVMGRLLPPSHKPVEPLRGYLSKVSDVASVPGRGQDLLNALRARVSDASQRREALLVARVVAELTAEGLLAAAPVVVVQPDSPLLAQVVVALDVCPVPLPGWVLMAATGLSQADLESLVVEQVDLGLLRVNERGDYSRAVAQEHRLGVEFGGDLVAKVMRQLCVAVESSSGAESWSWQVPNACALAAALGGSADAVVGDAFRSFDKAAKAYGDLWVTERFARLSSEAISRVMQTNLTEDEQTYWAYARAQTWICGQAWVWQRVGLLAKCEVLMDQAEELARRYDDEENLAFIFKCKGRVQRMQGEGAADKTDASELFASSARLLEDAYPMFAMLLTRNTRFFEDRGECVALLARTLAADGDLVGARAAIGRAHQLLDSRPGSKAYADLVLLEAEIALPDDVEEIEGEASARRALAEHRVVLDELVARHDPDVDDLSRRVGGGTSEIAARVYVVRGRLQEVLGDREGAERDLERAVDIYEGLRHYLALSRAKWKLIELGDAPLPTGLVEAFDRGGASEGARVFAVAHLAELTRPSGAEAPEVLLPPASDAEYWDGVVSLGARRHAAVTPNWDEGRETA